MRQKKPPPEIDLNVTVRKSDFDADHGRCALEVALLRESWITDAFTGPTAIDVLSESGKVARFLPSTVAWSVMRMSDRGECPRPKIDVRLPGGRIIYTMPDFGVDRPQNGNSFRFGID